MNIEEKLKAAAEKRFREGETKNLIATIPVREIVNGKRSAFLAGAELGRKVGNLEGRIATMNELDEAVNRMPKVLVQEYIAMESGEAKEGLSALLGEEHE